MAGPLEKVKLYCPKCQKTMSEDNFYTMKDKSRSDMCKACETMHINNWDPETFKWLLKKYDVPYIEAEWNILRDRAYQKDPYKMTGMSVFGKYLSKMKLKQWNMYGWEDTERLKFEAEEKAKLYGQGPQNAEVNFSPERIMEIQEKYNRGEISEAEYLTYTESAAPDMTKGPYQSTYTGNPDIDMAPAKSPYPANSNPFVQVEIPDVGADLTEEDKVYLAMKWGRLYTAEDWVQLEKFYDDMMKSFDIQSAAHIDTLKFICKTSLKMNQALDAGDIDTYQKLSKVYDAQMKAGKFTEAQNKEEKGDEFDSVGAIVAFAEREAGAIPRYKVAKDFDKADEILSKLKKYNQDFINSDPGLAQQFENYLKKREIADEQKRDRQAAKEQGLDYVEIKDEDYVKMQELMEEEKEKDWKLIAGTGEEGEA